MIKAFKTLLGLDAVSDNVCLFVDGLDEYDGDYDVMTEMVLHMVSSSNRQKLRLELCLSSRPLPVFKDAFKPCPKIRLEDRTFQDINSYVEGTLGKTEGMQQSIKQDLDTADQLFRDVASEASGVFLRVRLVVLSNPFGRVPENPIDFQTSGEDWKNYLPISRAFTGVCWRNGPLRAGTTWDGGTCVCGPRTFRSPPQSNTENDDDGQSTDMVTKWKVA